MTLLEQQPIVQRCAELFLVAPRDLTGRYRFDFVMRARFALYLALRLQGRSYPNIGKIVDRDHTTVMDGVKRAECYYERDSVFASSVNELSRIRVE